MLSSLMLMGCALLLLVFAWRPLLYLAGFVMLVALIGTLGWLTLGVIAVGVGIFVA